MIRVAAVGVHDHMENMTGFEVISRNLISRAAPTARLSTSTEKMTALLVSVGLVNMCQQPLSPTGEAAGCVFSPSLSGRLIKLYGARRSGTPVELPVWATRFCPAPGSATR